MRLADIIQLEAGGPGSGRKPTGAHANYLDALKNGRYAYERKAAEAVLSHPHVNEFIDSKKSMGWAGPHGVWQTIHTGSNSEAANNKLSKLRDKALKLGYAPAKIDQNVLKHPSGSKVELTTRTSITPGGKVGKGVQISFHNFGQKKEK